MGQALNNTDVQVGIGQGGNLQVAVVPNQPNNNNNAGGEETCDSDDCDCWEVGQDYAGGDLRVRNNPRRVSSAQRCQQASGHKVLNLIIKSTTFLQFSLFNVLDCKN